MSLEAESSNQEHYIAHSIEKTCGYQVISLSLSLFYVMMYAVYKVRMQASCACECEWLKMVFWIVDHGRDEVK